MATFIALSEPRTSVWSYAAAVVGKFELVGVNCDGDSEVQGDVFWTMYPKYKLSY